MNLLSCIKDKNKSQLEGMFRQAQVNTRIWVQEHGEKALFAGIALGLILSFAFKLALVIVILSVLVGFALWYLAPEEDPSTPLPESSNVADTTASQSTPSEESSEDEEEENQSSEVGS